MRNVKKKNPPERLKRNRKTKGLLRQPLKAGFRISLKILLAGFILSLIQVWVLKYIDPPFTGREAFMWVKGRMGMDSAQQSLYQWRPIKEISPHLVLAVLAAEDQRFLSHRGFDFIELNLALQDMAAGERLRGASTISMQTARTVFLWQGRSWLRKTLEAYYTVLIELLWGKKRILEIYLNKAEWGTNIMGAEAAAKQYFRKPAAALTPEEGALIAAILPAPQRFSAVHPSDYVRERQKRILKDMQNMKLP